MKPIFVAVFVVLCGLCAATSLAQAAPPAAKPAPDPASEIVSRLEKLYQQTSDIHGRFEQEVESGLGRKRRASGQVWLKKPGRMRFEYQKPEPKLMVADGESLWVYEPEDEQAFRQNLNASSLPSSVSFLWGEKRLGQEFAIRIESQAKDLAGPGEVVLRLEPKEPTAQYRYLLFIVNEKTATVTGTIIYDQQGGTSRLRFFDLETNRGIKDDKFSFKPPKGTRILRQ